MSWFTRLVMHCWGLMLTVEAASCSLNFLFRRRIVFYISATESRRLHETSCRCGMNLSRIGSPKSIPLFWQTRTTDWARWAGNLEATVAEKCRSKDLKILFAFLTVNGCCRNLSRLACEPSAAD